MAGNLHLRVGRKKYKISYMIRDRFFIVAAQRPWDAASPGRGQLMASGISRANRVLYVNPPLDPEALMAGGRGEEYAIERVNPNLWVLEAPIILPQLEHIRSVPVFDMMNRNNNRLYADAVKWALAHLGEREYYLLCDNDPVRCFYLPQMLHPALTVYYRHDGHAAHQAVNMHTPRLEAELARRSDLVVAATESHAALLLRHNPDTYFIGQGAPGGPADDWRSWSVPVDRLYALMALVGASAAGVDEELPLTDMVYS